jgi:hypothetical protein
MPTNYEYYGGIPESEGGISTLAPTDAGVDWDYGPQSGVSIPDLETYVSEYDIDDRYADADNFDWIYYLNSNPDLIAGGVDTEEEAYRHWVNYGAGEDSRTGYYFKYGNPQAEFDLGAGADVDPDWTPGSEFDPGNIGLITTGDFGAAGNLIPPGWVGSRFAGITGLDLDDEWDTLPDPFADFSVPELTAEQLVAVEQADKYLKDLAQRAEDAGYADITEYLANLPVGMVEEERNRYRYYGKIWEEHSTDYLTAKQSALDVFYADPLFRQWLGSENAEAWKHQVGGVLGAAYGLNADEIQYLISGDGFNEFLASRNLRLATQEDVDNDPTLYVGQLMNIGNPNVTVTELDDGRIKTETLDPETGIIHVVITDPSAGGSEDPSAGEVDPPVVQDPPVVPVVDPSIDLPDDYHVNEDGIRVNQDGSIWVDPSTLPPPAALLDGGVAYDLFDGSATPGGWIENFTDGDGASIISDMFFTGDGSIGLDADFADIVSGVDEARFDADAYLAANPGLEVLDPDLLYWHWLQAGMDEGRSGGGAGDSAMDLILGAALDSAAIYSDAGIDPSSHGISIGNGVDIGGPGSGHMSGTGWFGIDTTAMYPKFIVDAMESGGTEAMSASSGDLYAWWDSLGEEERNVVMESLSSSSFLDSLSDAERSAFTSNMFEEVEMENQSGDVILTSAGDEGWTVYLVPQWWLTQELNAGRNPDWRDWLRLGADGRKEATENQLQFSPGSDFRMVDMGAVNIDGATHDVVNFEETNLSPPPGNPIFYSTHPDVGGDRDWGMYRNLELPGQPETTNPLNSDDFVRTLAEFGYGGQPPPNEFRPSAYLGAIPPLFDWYDYVYGRGYPVPGDPEGDGRPDLVAAGINSEMEAIRHILYNGFREQNSVLGYPFSEYNQDLPQGWKPVYQDTPGYARGGLVSLQSANPSFERLAGGGVVGGYSGGMDDLVPAVTDGNSPAALSSGEFVVPADVVAHLGDGNTQNGSAKLMEMLSRIRQQKTGVSEQPRAIQDEWVLPA